MQTDALAKSEAALDYEPRSLGEAMELAKMLAGSALLPRNLKTPQDVLVVMMTGKELGISTMQAVRSIWVNNGKPELSADLLVGLVKRHRDVCEWFIVEDESDEQHGVVTTKRVGAPKPERFTYTLEDARLAGLLGKDNWRRHPKDMLLARACARAARKVYPDLVANMYLPDELEDVRPAQREEREINPAPVTKTAELKEQLKARGLKAEEKPVGPKLGFGPRKGVPLSELTSQELSSALDAAQLQLDENPKARWAARLRANLTEVEAELEARQMREDTLDKEGGT
jgi:hypothetical protein